MKPHELVNIFDQFEDPGPQPEYPGTEPPINDLTGRSVWRLRMRVRGDWYKKNRRFLLARQAVEINTIPTEKRSDVQNAVVLLAAVVLASELDDDRNPFTMLGLT